MKAYIKQTAGIRDPNYHVSPPSRPAIVSFMGTDFATPIPETPGEAISYNKDAELMVVILNII